MARNKYPEQTIERILEIAGRLFIEKGYDQTSIQDIVNELGMSKGAIYHHFKSKEDILDHYIESYYHDACWFEKIRCDKSLTGLQKLQKIIAFNLQDETKLNLDSMILSVLKNPKILAAQLRETVTENSLLLVGMIEEGNRDGSLRVRNPRAASEALMLLINMWLNPGVFQWTQEEFVERLEFIQEFCEGIGMPILNDEIMAIAKNYLAAVTTQ